MNKDYFIKNQKSGKEAFHFKENKEKKSVSILKHRSGNRRE
ncbi:hypothetical protein [Marinilactibacillus psychrotolerans]